MHLGLVLTRLLRGYYRSGNAVLSDLELIATNAAAFNNPEDKITEMGLATVARLRKVWLGEES